VTSADGRAGDHRRAVLLMAATALMWSTAGVVTRHLTPQLVDAGRFEVAFWRSLFAALFVGGYLLMARREGLRPVWASGRAGLVSGLMWATMFSTFMLALTLTSVADTLIVMSLAPLVTALLARDVLRAPVPPRTWVAIGAATLGIVAMFAGASGGDAGAAPGRWLGVAIAFAIPLAQAVNLVTLQKTRAHVDLVPAVFIGGAIGAAAMLPLALPLRAGASDLILLAGLGCFQLGLPCMMMVVAARRLSAPEVSLLGLLEVVLGPIWAWLGAGEVPAARTLTGGAIVVAALVGNELTAVFRQRLQRG
jgi:drug/metabolite transporter (DMT)-like permease